MASKSKAASLTGSLLAPKGEAEPAAPSSQSGNGAAADPAAGAVTPIDGAAVDVEGANGGGIQFPLRLDPAEHLELRMAAARLGRSCQDLIVEALTRYLAEIAAESGKADPPHSGGAQ